MTSRLRGLIAACLVACLAVAVTAPAALAQTVAETPEEKDILAMLEERDQQIKTILDGSTSSFSQEQREELQTLINGVIDFRAMGQQALGPHWTDLSDEQRDEFVDVFRDVVRAQSLADLEVYNSMITYDKVSVDGDSAYVRTITEYKGTKTPVEYILERSDDEWLAQDIIVDDVSTAEGYARSFQSVVRKRGFDALMNSLRKKRDKVVASG